MKAQTSKPKSDTSPRVWRALLTLAAGIFLTCPTVWAEDDPPSRVARLAVVSGDVQFAPAGENQWAQASLNRPMVVGDKLMTESGARAAIQLGGAEMRLNQASSFNFLNLTDQTAQLELANGTLNLSVGHLESGQTYEVDTPTLAFVVSEPGIYRLDVAPDGQSTTVATYRGSGTVYGANDARYDLRQGQSYRFSDSELRTITGGPLPYADDFDQWCSSRDQREVQADATQYASPNIVGSEDLASSGSWQDDENYGAVWFPTLVAPGWAPYRYGHWAWIDPWGWTWIDDAPWGYAPFHYGRWVNVDNRWGWIPGPRVGRPVYSPALVGFVGGGIGLAVGIGVGWFPLGPQDVYCPPYRASQAYFNNVNVTNVRNINVVNITTVYNNYNVSSGAIQNVHYAYQNQPGAVTAVPRDSFVQAKPVGLSRVQVDETQLAHAKVTSQNGVTPSMASIVSGHGRRGDLPAPSEVFQTPVIARAAPAPAPIPFAQRETAIIQSGGQPMSGSQMHPAPNPPPSARTPMPTVQTYPSAPTPNRNDFSPQNFERPQAVVAPQPRPEPPHFEAQPAFRPPEPPPRPAPPPQNHPHPPPEKEQKKS